MPAAPLATWLLRNTPHTQGVLCAGDGPPSSSDGNAGNGGNVGNGGNGGNVGAALPPLGVPLPWCFCAPVGGPDLCGPPDWSAVALRPFGTAGRQTV